MLKSVLNITSKFLEDKNSCLLPAGGAFPRGGSPFRVLGSVPQNFDAWALCSLEHVQVCFDAKDEREEVSLGELMRW